MFLYGPLAKGDDTMVGRPGGEIPNAGSGEETAGSGPSKGGAIADAGESEHNLVVLAELLGADSDSVDLDTLFDAVQAVAGKGESVAGTVTDDAEGQPTRVIDDGSPESTYDKLVDTGDMDDLLDGILDTINLNADT